MSLFNHAKYLPDELNASSKEEIFYAFKQGIKDIYDKELSFESIIVLLAHSALETGHWKVGLHNWNFGNIRAYPDKLKDGEYFTMFRCGEILLGKEVFFEPPDPNSAFRAFLSREDGIRHHLSFLQKTRYVKAWKEVLNGNPGAYAHALRAGGYYTANEKLYTNTLVKLFNEFIKQKEAFLSYEPPKLVPGIESILVTYLYEPPKLTPEPNVAIKGPITIGVICLGILAWVISALGGCF